MKYHEGAVAALSELRKLIRRDRSATHVSPRVVQAVRDEWAAARAVHFSPDWAAYYDGGADAIDALLGGTNPNGATGTVQNST